MFLEMAIDTLAQADKADVADELKELNFLGDLRINSIAFGKTDFEKGYLLGITTARVLLETMPAAVIHGIMI